MSPTSPTETTGNTPRPCPICGKPPAEGVAPFCSKRCADVDLHRWLGGVYALPDNETGAPSGEPLPDEDT